MIKHILFDCDGVLIDTEIVAAEAVTNWLNTEGVDIDMETFITEYTGKTFTDIIQILKGTAALRMDIDLGEVIPMLDRHIRDNQRPIEGVREMLESVKLPITCVSNSDADYVALALQKLGVSDLFEGRIFSAAMVEKGKPDPAVYNLAIEKLSLKREEVLVVEDSSSGVIAARSADLKTIGFLGGTHVRAGHGDKLVAHGASALAGNHKELTELLQSL